MARSTFAAEKIVNDFHDLLWSIVRKFVEYSLAISSWRYQTFEPKTRQLLRYGRLPGRQQVLQFSD
jgi:hypothetical protein